MPDKSEREQLVSSGEWLWVAVATLLILAFSTVPYLVGLRVQDNELVYSGAAFDRQDYAVHLATMHLGARGEWQYRMRFTSEQQQGAYVKLAYIFLGHVSRWLGADLALTFQLARLSFGFLACLAIYGLAVYSFAQVRWRRLFFLMAVLGSGLGWLQSTLNWLPQSDISPIDFWLIDAYTFFGLMVMPHFVADTALMIGMLLLSLSYLNQPAWWKWVLAAGCALVIQMIQPYTPVLIDVAILGAFLFHGWLVGKMRWGDWAFLTALGFIQLPLLLYNLSAFGENEYLSNFVAQNVTLSPPPVYYLWGFGLLWPLAILGVLYVWQRIRNRPAPPGVQPSTTVVVAALVWVIIAFTLAYAPTNLQRRFLHAVNIPLALLAVYGLRSIASKIEQSQVDWLHRYQNFLYLGLVAIASISSLLVCLGNTLYISQRPAGLFDPLPLVQAVDWLSLQSGPDDVVLAVELTGQLVAARAGLPVYLGHPIETIDYSRKTKEVGDFFTGKLPADWLRSVGVRWVIFGPYEQATHKLTSPWSDHQAIYRVGGVEIYRVNPGP